MEYRQLFADLRKRPDSYGLNGSFREAVAFIGGCDAGNSWGLLIGFREWLALKADAEANLTWSALVLRMAVGSTGLRTELSAADELRALDVLFEELDLFLAARNGPHRAPLIIAKYLKERGCL
ncbi:hypothetical protein N8J89_23200 [Crossiella sp. CA-258035]|uniref:hypothetical protein n=1 Tax=Crossiella sp. CA-258035 TaxID=2981138 RepID=UPI0024BCDB3C|nr:hypothetical protein [Crossiella sp. CA-258035]WHT16038.1 hypothetical protein N8J89_23200 [Crossiella sp. CA-258035]